MAEKQLVFCQGAWGSESQLLSKAKGAAVGLRWQSKPAGMGAAKEAVWWGTGCVVTLLVWVSKMSSSRCSLWGGTAFAEPPRAFPGLSWEGSYRKSRGCPRDSNFMQKGGECHALGVVWGDVSEGAGAVALRALGLLGDATEESRPGVTVPRGEGGLEEGEAELRGCAGGCPELLRVLRRAAFLSWAFMAKDFIFTWWKWCL